MNSYLTSAIKQFRYYRQLSEQAVSQLTVKEIFHRTEDYENSVAIIMEHLAGNMLSRWTDIFHTDGEKEWRQRDKEFRGSFHTKKGLLNYWEEGWYQLFTTLDDLQTEDLEKTIYIRSMGHSVTEAINRQLCHYAYHAGQIVLLAKQFRKEEWATLSIPVGKSANYNQKKNFNGRRKEHFTDDL
jgi:hypothetical protein